MIRGEMRGYDRWRFAGLDRPADEDDDEDDNGCVDVDVDGECVDTDGYDADLERWDGVYREELF